MNIAAVGIATGQLLVDLVLGGFGLSGIVGAVVALKKLPGERRNQTATESQINIDTMARLRDELIEAEEYWKKRALAAEAELSELHKLGKRAK